MERGLKLSEAHLLSPTKVERGPVGSREVGHSLAIVDHAAEALDRRASEKWPELVAT